MELKDVFVNTEYFHLEDHTWHTVEADACQFGYHDSIFKQELKGKVFVTSVTLKLNKRPNLNTTYSALSKYLEEQNITVHTVKDISDAVIAIRRSKLPDPAVLGNAGSFFKNPEILTAHYDELPGVTSRYARV